MRREMKKCGYEPDAAPEPDVAGNAMNSSLHNSDASSDLSRSRSANKMGAWQRTKTEKEKKTDL